MAQAKSNHAAKNQEHLKQNLEKANNHNDAIVQWTTNQSYAYQQSRAAYTQLLHFNGVESSLHFYVMLKCIDLNYACNIVHEDISFPLVQK